MSLQQQFDTGQDFNKVIRVKKFNVKAFRKIFTQISQEKQKRRISMNSSKNQNKKLRQSKGSQIRSIKRLDTLLMKKLCSKTYGQKKHAIFTNVKQLIQSIKTQKRLDQQYLNEFQQLKISQQVPQQILDKQNVFFMKRMVQLKKSLTIKIKQKDTNQLSTPRKRQDLHIIRRDSSTAYTVSQNGIIHGYTQIDYKDGSYFKGIFNQGQIISGEIVLINGFKYKGQFQSGKFHGAGQMIFPSGQTFQGKWVYGVLIGQVKIKYPKGQIYYGHILNFKRSGNGYLYFQNGNKYAGEFQNGQITGFGQLFKNDGTSKKGYWIQGKYIGNDQKQFNELKKIFIKKINQIKLTKRKIYKPKDIQNFQQSSKGVNFCQIVSDIQFSSQILDQVDKIN